MLHVILSMPPRFAATTVVLRDSASGPQVAMVRRDSHTPAAAGAWVFPGGGVDQSDSATAQAVPIDDAEMARRSHLGTPDATAYFVAALRELFEEAGVLLTTPPVSDERQVRWRAELFEGVCSFPGLLKREGLQLDLDALVYFAHWRTPEGRPKRFDTRFFVTSVPSDRTIRSDGHETVAHEWVRPDDALERYDRGEWQLLLPTRSVLKALCPFSSVDETLAFWRRQPPPTMMQPVDVVRDGQMRAELPR